MTAREPIQVAHSLAQMLAADLSKAPPMDSTPDYATWLAALRKHVEGQGGSVRETTSGTTIRAHGIVASATAGLVQACRNYIAQVATKRAAAQADDA